jgi:DNA-binding PadR family transcriptional regulator
MSLEVEIQILSTVKNNHAGVRDISKMIRKRTQTVVSTIKKMNAAGLVEVESEETNRRGRPRQIVKATTLGEDYLEAYQQLRLKPLRGTKNDLLKAKRDAEYVNRLVEQGKDPYEAFLELNTLVRA